MRISAVARAATRERLITTARRLFAERGYDRTTTRDIATASGAAAGTLFNYFESKEALGLVLLEETIDETRAGFSREGSLEEALFSHAATTLDSMGACRNWAGQLLAADASPVASGRGSLRARVLEVVSQLVGEYGRGSLSPVMMHLYWTLYLGVVVFWSHDPSARQADTHALLDRSLRLFVRALDEASGKVTAFRT